MLKEIYEQPDVICDTFRGRLLTDQGLIRMAGIEDHLEKFINAKRIIIVACGTSWHAGLVAEYMIEELDRKSTRLNSSHVRISYAVFCLKKKIKNKIYIGSSYS